MRYVFITGILLFALLVVMVIMTVVVAQQEQTAAELAIDLHPLSKATIITSRLIGTWWWVFIPLAPLYVTVVFLFARKAQRDDSLLARWGRNSMTLLPLLGVLVLIAGMIFSHNHIQNVITLATPP